MKLKIENGCFSYRKGVPILDGLSMQASGGDVVAVLGPNGAGKTTFLKCLMGFLPWSQGKATLDGTDIRELPSRTLWQTVSYVPQSRTSVSPLTAREMILLGMTSRIGVFSSPRAEDVAYAETIAKELGIAGLLDKKCTEMSGGERQMVLIARALASKPSLLILDEPESNLDFRNQMIVLDAISRLAAGGMCCVFNTHYPDHALSRANKSLILRKGGESVFGNTADVVTEKEIRRTFGVVSAIHRVETAGNQYHGILPLALANDEAEAADKEPDAGTIAVLSILFSDYTLSPKINALLHEYRGCLIGRMGMPYKGAGVYIITVMLDAPQHEVDSLLHRLGVLPGVNVKATVTKKKTPKE